MSRRALHILLALGLALSVFAGTLLTSSAQTEPNWVLFPWVPNGAVIDDPRDFGTTGPYYGTVTIQNLEDEEIDIFYTSTTDDDVDFGDLGTYETASLDAYASVTLSTGDIFDVDNDVDGSGVAVTARFDDSDVPARISGVQKQATPSPDVNARTSADHETVGGYTGLTLEGVGQNVVLPIAQTNSNWNTLVRVTNFNPTQSGDITVTFHPAGATGWSASFTADDVDPGETVTFDLLASAPPGEWVGSAEIDADINVGAVAERVKNETNMLIMNTSQLSPENGDEQYAPLVFNNFNFWNTGISIANLSDVENDVTITYYDLEGEQAGEVDTLTVPPNGMAFEYTPATNGDGEEFIGSAIIEADGPIVGAVDEVKYFGDDPNTGHAMSYMVEDLSAVAGQSLALALVQKGTVDAQQVAHGDTTGIHLFNPSDEDVQVAITYFDQDGNVELTDFETLGGKEGYTSYTVDIPQLGENFKGSAVIQVVSGAGSVVAASNNVNYDVEFDGSASFNLVLTGDVELEPENDAN